MTLFEAIIFGIVQGITEFLPISSTAHIVITQLIFGYTFPGLAFEVYLHLASVLAVILYFWKDLLNIIRGFFFFIIKRRPEDKVPFNFGLYILIATALTGILGSLLQDSMADSLKSPPIIALSLAITGLALIFIDRFHKVGQKDESSMTFTDAIIVGLGQTLAVFPGISRSGSTLVVGLLRGLNRDTAVRYSFLLAIPAILGSTVLSVGEFSAATFAFIGPVNLIVTFVVTFIFSVLGIIWLIDFLKRSKLIYFAIYCFILAIFVFVAFDSGTVIDV